MQKKKLKNIRKKNSLKTSHIKVDLIDHCGSDLSVVNAARVSFHKESDWDASDLVQTGPCLWVGKYKLKASDAKLITYLAKHKHTSPFNHCFISVRVKAPIFVSRQLVKHKFMPWNEVSRRYVQDEPSFYQMRFRWAADNVKQGSGAEVDEQTQAEADAIFWHAVDVALEAYDKLLAKGICPEQARGVLPVDQITEWVWSGTLGAFADMLALRLDPHAQQESREVAEQIKALIEPLFPVALPALLEAP
jgi:thymidylate synthase (FAD)